ncbi:MAG: type III-A CRISPR-associated protein Csm2 [Coriobacteriia bacterium]|nr:type III-A CRISPR-associated protein Csm2 [Coriobacteriia bacterium]
MPETSAAGVCLLGGRLTKMNYASLAERIIENGAYASGNGGLSMSKLRGVYALITNVYSRIHSQADFENYCSDLQYVKVKMAYESGRDRVVGDFIKKTCLMSAIDDVETYEQFILYCRYAESLVAYFKFYGGRD